MTLDPSVARRTYRTVEPIHAMVYFTPHGPPAYQAIGLRGQRMGYFASRSAALGPVPAEVVIATFFNFNPALVRRAIPEAWTLATPTRVLETRSEVVDRSLLQAWGAERLAGPEVREAADLARIAAEAALVRTEGRPLFAAHASLPWPAEPHLVLWHAQTLLREYRGDAHVALLTAAGLDPVEVLVCHAATGDVPAEILRTTRGFDEPAWSAGIQRVRGRGWLDGGDGLTLSPSGQEHRRGIEDQTDALSVVPYQALGEERCARLRELARPLSVAVIDAGLLMPRALSEEDV